MPEPSGAQMRVTCGEEADFEYKDYFGTREGERLVRVSQCQCTVNPTTQQKRCDLACDRTGLDDDAQWGRISWAKQQGNEIEPCPPSEDCNGKGYCADLLTGKKLRTDRSVVWQWQEASNPVIDNEEHYQTSGGSAKIYPFVVRTKPSFITDPVEIRKHLVHKDDVEIGRYRGLHYDFPDLGSSSYFVDINHDQDLIIEGMKRIGLLDNATQLNLDLIFHHLDVHADRLDIVDVDRADDYEGDTPRIDVINSAAAAFDRPSSSPVMFLFGGERADASLSDTLWVKHENALGRILWREVTRDSADDPWPAPRAGMSMTYDTVHDRLLMLGGRTDRGLSNELWAFDIATERWSTIELPDIAEDMPFPGLAYYSSVSDGENWYIYGGTTFIGNMSYVAKWSYADETLEFLWADEDGPGPRRGASLALDETNGRLLLFGGDAELGGVLSTAYEGDDLPERYEQRWDADGVGVSVAAPQDALLLDDQGATYNGYSYFLGGPYLRDATVVDLEFRARVEHHHPVGDFTGVGLGLGLDRGGVLGFAWRDGKKHLVLGDAETLEDGQVDPSWPGYPVNWSRYHDYQVVLQRASDTISVWVDDELAFTAVYSDLPEAGPPDPETGLPEHFGMVNMATGMGEATGRSRWDHVRFRWKGDGEYLNDAWSFDLSTRTWNVILSQCVIGTEDCPAASAFSAARYYNPEPGELFLVGGMGPPGEPVPRVRSLAPDAADPEIVVREFASSLPKSEGDCNGDGRIDEELGRLCTADVHWWDPVGRLTCGESDAAECSAAPAEAEVLGQVRLPFKVNAFDVVGYRIVAATMVGLVVIDASNPHQPRRERIVPLGPTQDVKVRDGYAYVGHLFGLGVIDLDSGEIAGWAFSGMHVDGVALSGDRAYTAGKRHLGVVDISSPEQPVVLARTTGLRRGADVVASGPFAMVADREGLKTYRVEPNGTAEQLGFGETGRPLESMYFQSGGLYALDRSGQEVFINLHDMASPEIAGAHSMASLVRGRVDSDGITCGLVGKRTIEIVEITP